MKLIRRITNAVTDIVQSSVEPQRFFKIIGRLLQRIKVVMHQVERNGRTKAGALCTGDREHFCAVYFPDF